MKKGIVFISMLVFLGVAVIALGRAAYGDEILTGWDKNFSGPPQGSDSIRSIAIDVNNNVYVAGEGWDLISSTSQDDWWIKKFNSSGYEDTTNWNKTFSSAGSQNDFAYSVACDANGSVYIAGTGVNIVSGGSSWDWWIKKFYSNGTEDTANWNKSFNGVASNGVDYAYSVAIDGDYVYIGGSGENLARSNETAFCQGTPGVGSCDSLDEPDCNPVAGCNWSSQGDCTGSGECSDFDGNEPGCSAHTGCTYNLGDDTCAGSYDCSAYYTNESTCTTYTGCSWGDTSVCNGTPSACLGISDSVCSSITGC